MVADLKELPTLEDLIGGRNGNGEQPAVVKVRRRSFEPGVVTATTGRRNCAACVRSVRSASTTPWLTKP